MPFLCGDGYLFLPTGKSLRDASQNEVIPRLAEALAPGGALLIEEWGNRAGDLLHATDHDARELYRRYSAALLRVFAAAGNDTLWADDVHAALVAAGLTRVETVLAARSWPAGSAGALIPALVSQELQTHLVRAGITAAELDRLRAALTDPRTVVLGNPTLSTVGYQTL